MRLMKLYLVLVGMGLRSELQYRINCIMLIIMGLIWQGTAFVFIWLILSQFHTLAGWSLGEIAFLYGFRLIVHALNMIVFGLFQRIQSLVSQGDFDIFLIRPFPVLIQMMTSRFQISAFGDLLGGGIVFVAACTQININWSPLTFFYLLLAIIGGCLVEGAVKLAISSLVFRTLSVYNLISLFDNTMSLAGNYPMTIYGHTTRFLFTFILPIAFLAYFPVTVLLRRTSELSVSPLFAYLASFVGIILFILAYLFFRHEIKHYQSSGH
jgi:ABC-2 type transport system permease protein